jgi:hypothetical protein
MPSTPLLPDRATELLLGRLRRRVLTLLLIQANGQAGERFHLRELARLAGASAGAAQRELRALEGVGLVRSERRGNQVGYHADEASPILPALRAFLEQTAGAPDLIRAALAPLADRISFALIHGPAAAGTADAESGIDLYIVGEVQPGDIGDALACVAPRLGRPVYLGVSTRADFDRRAVATGHFATAILDGPCITLIGEPPFDWVGWPPRAARATFRHSPTRARP